ncbi:MAG: papain-like cysteine protease family protein [Sulfitobacter sp.]|nr:papain-like cysteine protease family protein [Sulfitobacter sp.]
MADYSAAALQQTEVWCWAASIETVFRTAGVSWSQKDIVTAVKGFPAFSTANAGEMSLFLNGFDFDYDGSTWKGESEYFKGAMPANRLIKEIKAGRPAIFAVRTGGAIEHAVIVYGVLRPDGGGIHSIYYFDPYTGKKDAIPGSQVPSVVTNSWTAKIHRY